MIIILSKNRVPIRLTDERWAHIRSRHPELEKIKDRVLHTIAEPDYIYKGDSSELLAIKAFEKLPVSARWLVVAYREIGSDDGFVLTAYVTNRLAQWRKIIWKR